MQRRPFTSRAEVDAYLDSDELACLECGRRLRSLAHHLRRAHALSCEDYRALWGLPAGTPLAGRSTRAAHAEKARRLIAEGRLAPNHAAAAEAARGADRRSRVAWQRVEQAERARAIPHATLPPNARRADGRDADHAREYQRAYRARRRRGSDTENR